MPQQTAGAADDGRLAAWKIAQPKLDFELVVFSNANCSLALPPHPLEILAFADECSAITARSCILTRRALSRQIANAPWLATLAIFLALHRHNVPQIRRERMTGCGAHPPSSLVARSRVQTFEEKSYRAQRCHLTGAPGFHAER